MPVNLESPERLEPVAGIRVGTTALGVRSEPRDDLTLFEIAPGAALAATFTRNAFRAAPVTLALEHRAQGTPRYLVINAGNANAGTGAPGLQAARRVCDLVARAGGCEPEQVLPFSTGVVGEILDPDPFEAALPRALGALSEGGWLAASRAIMTTDIVAKGVSRGFRAGGREHTITGIVKGSGMICPDMATMLAFVATDAGVAPALLDEVLADAVDESFNCITVDGDTSTNDACVLVASGAGVRIDDPAGDDAAALRGAVNEVCTLLAQAVVRDGEGASKFITVEVAGGRDSAECRQIAYTVAHSPLVKTAMFASDANWGRILAAVGRAGVAGLDIDRVRMHLGDVLIVENGARASSYREELGAAVMARDEIEVRIALGRGEATARVWTCDLSHDYVTINAEYRT
jgi:glutamate N-acetyltransferase/amino-acid N-acetyltransferase